MLPGDFSMILPRSPSILFALRIFQALRMIEYRNTEYSLVLLMAKEILIDMLKDSSGD